MRGDAVDPADTPFSEDEFELILSIYESCGKYSGPELSKLTHQECPWVDARARAGVSENESFNEPISLESMKAFFQDVVLKYDIEDATDVGRYVEARILDCA